ncbi:MAG TPA: FGLLP motif-containing membrane protein [Actinomycetota bacterium]|nr:FGLLP motif-containing membrane protein [Actinomycetota bacterium]
MKARRLGSVALLTFAALTLIARAAAASTAAPAIWAWGQDGYGQLGDGAPGDGNSLAVAAPVRVHSPHGVDFTAVAVGDAFTIALDTRGHAWAWGSNSYGDLGIGDAARDHASLPTAVKMPKGVTFTQISASSGYALALDDQGRMWGWGRDDAGQLADGAPTNIEASPVRATMPQGVRFTQIAAGSVFAAALDHLGRAWAWGNNDQGQLGTGDTNPRTTPTAVVMPAAVRFTRIAAGGLGGPGGGAHTVALDSQRRVWAWGDNQAGEVGDGTTNNRSVPVLVQLPAGVRIATIAAGGVYSLALDETGQLWGWGGAGAIGGGNQFDASRFGQGAGETHVPVKTQMPPGIRFTYVAAGFSTSIALDQHGNAWTFGDGAIGELGNGAVNTFSLTPVQVTMPPGVRWTSIATGSTSTTLVGFVAAKKDDGFHLSTFATALMLPAQAIKPATSIAISAAIAAAGALFLKFPANLFNTTFDENYALIVAWWARMRRRRPREDRPPQRSLVETKSAFIGVLLIGALLEGLLDPTFGWNRSSIATFIALLGGLLVTVLLVATVTAIVQRVRYGAAPAAPRALLLGLLVAAGLVLLSRACGFQPGYVYGIVATVKFRRTLTKSEDGQVVAVTSIVTLIVGVAAWFAIVPVTHYEAAHGLGLGIVILHNFLAILFTSSLVALVLGLFPLTFMPGHKLRAWNPRMWWVVFTVSLGGLIQCLLRPHDARPSKAPLVSSVLLFVAFGVFSVLFHHALTRRNRRARGERPPRVRETLLELAGRRTAV